MTDQNRRRYPAACRGVVHLFHGVQYSQDVLASGSNIKAVMNSEDKEVTDSDVRDHS
jgi:hypothetical protein